MTTAKTAARLDTLPVSRTAVILVPRVTIGEAAGRISGNSMFLNYVLEVPYGDGTIHLTMDDRMYLVEPRTLLNETTMYKFGFRVGEVLLVMRKHP
ncbi:MAG: DUF3833 family protein [Desulfobacterales bacterium]